MSTDTMEKIQNLISSNPQHIVPAARHFEKLYRAEPNNIGYRRTYFALSRQLGELYPIKFPVSPPLDEVPEAAKEDDDHEYWVTEPYNRFCAAYDRLKSSHGFVNAHLIVSELQAAGQDLI